MSGSVASPSLCSRPPARASRPSSWMRDRLQTGSWLLLFATPTLLLLAAERAVLGNLSGFPLDDSYIHFVFARGLARGEGLSFDGLPPVPASTAPLWTAVVALLEELPGEPFVPVKLAGIALQVWSAWLIGQLAQSLGLSLRLSRLVGLLLASSGWLVWSALSGMEVSLAVLLALLGFRNYLEERRNAEASPRASLFFALASLARPELLILLVVSLIEEFMRLERNRQGELRLVRNRPLGQAVLVAGTALLPVVAVASVHLAISGSALPTTFAAKVGSGGGGLDLSRLGSTLNVLFLAEPLWVVLAGAGALEVFRRLGGPRDVSLLLPIWALGIPVGLVLLSGEAWMPIGNFGRYLFPALPAWLLLASLAVDRLQGSFRALLVGRWRLPLGTLGLAFLLAGTWFGTLRAGGLFLRSRVDVERSVIAMARWITANLPPQARLATPDVGALAYYTENPIVDLAGLLQPEVTRRVSRDSEARRGQWARVVLAWIEEQRPDFVVVYPRWFPLLEADSLSFPVLLRLKLPQNLTMGGDELVLYATPWNRYPLDPDLLKGSGLKP